MTEKGQIYSCKICENRILVSKSGEGVLTCCEESMEVGKFLGREKEIKMFSCKKCENQIIVLQSGKGVLSCCEKTMEILNYD